MPNAEVAELSRVAVLCCRPHSVYKSIEGLDCYDRRRDARTFAGGMPVIAHPPCRYWLKGLFGRQARAAADAAAIQAERELGLRCAEQVKRWGGILEQPRGSELWEAADLPPPGRMRPREFSLLVWQSWWGFEFRKATWLFFSGIDRDQIRLPIMHMRFANWLVDLARMARPAENHKSQISSSK